jgi:ribosomal protein S18 acetylase RimI-like enzyme
MAHIRTSEAADLPSLEVVTELTGLFPADMLEGMMRRHLEEGTSSELWLTAVDTGPVAFAFARLEELTEGTWNLLALAVHPAAQGRGVGADLVGQVERSLASRGERIVLIETSGSPDFDRTRQFYRNLGYTEEARIRDFWSQGDDKVVFTRALGT